MGCMQEAMLFKYTIYNRTKQVQQIEANIESSDTFMLAGNSRIQFRILPQDEHTIVYSLYPMSAGELQLPQLHITLPAEYEGRSGALTEELLPTHIFVKPQPSIPVQYQQVKVL